MTAAVTLPPGVLLCHLPSPFPLLGGGALHGAVAAYELTGPPGAPVVVVLGGISADRRPAAWWPGVVGPGAAIDPARYRVLSLDWLGGAGCSTAPAAGEPFPFVATADQASALAHVLDAAGIARVHALVGASYGGMVGLAFAARHGDRLGRLCAIAAAERSHPQASAFRAVQRGVVRLGLAHGAGSAALSLARQLAMATYRSPRELAQRFGGAADLSGGAVRLPVQGWLEARGAAFAARFLGEQFLCLNASIDAHEVDPAAVAVDTTLVAFDSDQLVPPGCVRRLAAALPRLSRHVELATPYGHDAFLKETAAVAAVVAEVLS